MGFSRVGQSKAATLVRSVFEAGFGFLERMSLEGFSAN
jgi:hypothetical protein